MKKRMMALAMAAVMTGSLAAGTVTVNAAEPYKIAIGLADSGATMFSVMSNNIKAYAEATGGEVVFQGEQELPQMQQLHLWKIRLQLV